MSAPKITSTVMTSGIMYPAGRSALAARNEMCSCNSTEPGAARPYDANDRESSSRIVAWN